MTAAAVAPDGKQVVLGSQSGLRVCSWPDLNIVRALESTLDHVHDVKFSPDGRWLLAAGGSPAESGEVEVYEWPAGRQVRRVGGHADVVYRVAWSPDGKSWGTAGADSICQVIDAMSGEQQVRYEGHSRPVLGIGFLGNGSQIATAGVDQTIRLWDALNGEHLRTLDNHVGTVNDLAVRPGGEGAGLPVVASVSEDRTVRLWQPTIGRLMRFTRLPVAPRVVMWAPAGDRLLVGCNDGKVRVIDPDSVEVVQELEGLPGRVHELSWDVSAGRLLVAGEAGRAVVLSGSFLGRP